MNEILYDYSIGKKHWDDSCIFTQIKISTMLYKDLIPAKEYQLTLSHDDHQLEYSFGALSIVTKYTYSVGECQYIINTCLPSVIIS